MSSKGGGGSKKKSKLGKLKSAGKAKAKKFGTAGRAKAQKYGAAGKAKAQKFKTSLQDRFKNRKRPSQRRSNANSFKESKFGKAKTGLRRRYSGLKQRWNGRRNPYLRRQVPSSTVIHHHHDDSSYPHLSPTGTYVFRRGQYVPANSVGPYVVGPPPTNAAVGIVPVVPATGVVPVYTRKVRPVYTLPVATTTPLYAAGGPPMVPLTPASAAIHSLIGAAMEDVHKDQPLLYGFKEAMVGAREEMGTLANEDIPLNIHQIMTDAYIKGKPINIGIRFGDMNHGDWMTASTPVHYINEDSLISHPIPSSSFSSSSSSFSSSSSIQSDISSSSSSSSSSNIGNQLLIQANPFLPIKVRVSSSSGSGKHDEENDENAFEHEDFISLENLSHVEEHHSGVHQTKNHLVHIPVLLYNPTLHDEYVHHHIPTPHGILTLRSNGHGKPYSLVSFQLGLDYNPSFDQNEFPTGVPALTGTMDMPAAVSTPIIRLDTSKYVDKMHQVIQNKINEIQKDNPTIVSIASSSPFSSSSTDNTYADFTFISSVNHISPNDDQMVYWGEMSWTAISYAIIKLLKDQEDSHRFHDPMFLVDIFEKDEIGKKLVKIIVELYKKTYEQVVGKDIEQTVRKGVQLFPSLAQLLNHTSGLPAFGKTSDQGIYERYDSITRTLEDAATSFSSSFDEKTLFSNDNDLLLSLSSTSSSKGPDAILEKHQNMFLEKLSEMKQLAHVPDSVFGTPNNATEAAILWMFLYRYNSNIAPERTINNILKLMDSSINLKWNMQFKQGEMIEPEYASSSPLHFLNAINSTQHALRQFVTRLMEELDNPHCGNVFPSLLASPMHSPSQPIEQSEYIAWHSTMLDGHEVISTTCDVLGINACAVFLIPSANFWGIVIERVTKPYGRILIPSSELLGNHVFEALSPTIDSDDVEILPPLPEAYRQKISRQLSYCKLAMLTDDLNEKKLRKVGFDLSSILPSPDTVFVMPFVTQLSGKLSEAQIKVDPEYPNSRILIEVDFKDGADRKNTISAVYDDTHARFLIINQDGQTLGDEIFISQDYISIGPFIYLPKDKFDPKLLQYKAALKKLHEVASRSIDEGAAAKILKQVEQAPTSMESIFGRSSFFSSPSITNSSESSSSSLIGAAILPFLGGAVLGGLAATALTRPYYSPYYGYPYYGGYYGVGYPYYSNYYGYPYYGGYYNRRYGGHRHGGGRHHGGHSGGHGGGHHGGGGHR